MCWGNYVEKKSEEKRKVQSNEIMEESSWIWATEFVQRLSLKINILEFWNAKLPHICFDKLVWSPSSSLERTVNKHNKCKFGIISNTKYCFRWAFSYKVNGVTKRNKTLSVSESPFIQGVMQVSENRFSLHVPRCGTSQQKWFTFYARKPKLEEYFLNTVN